MSQTYPAFCTTTDLNNRLSADGATLRVDDGSTPTAQAALVADCIDDASAIIEEYCLGRYDRTHLADSRWVKHRCADLAAYILCERRGNEVPGGIEQKYARAMEKLERVLLRGLQIPDVPQRKSCVPSMSQPRATLRPFPRSVIERNRSTGKPEGYTQNRDPWDPLNTAANLNNQV